jgi:hypothetical protein
MPPGIPFRTSQFENRKVREVTTTHLSVKCKHDQTPSAKMPAQMLRLSFDTPDAQIIYRSTMDPTRTDRKA